MKFAICAAVLYASFQSVVMAQLEPISAVSAPDGTSSSFGKTVAISRDSKRMLVSDPLHDQGDGAVFIYERANCTIQDEDELSCEWQQVSTFQGNPGEQLGDRVVLSHDGVLFAIWRHQDGSSFVQVRRTDENHTQVGSDLALCDGDVSLALGQAFDAQQQTTAYHLLSGCASHDDHRGFVQCHSLDHHNSQWILRGPTLFGRYKDARFGEVVKFVESPSPLLRGQRSFRVAISSPNFDQGRGMVQVYSFIGMEWFQDGLDIVGEFQGGHFGESMDMSATNDPYLVVASQGSDEGDDLQPLVARVFHWRKTAFHTPYEWHLISEITPENGESPADDSSVAITRDGGRMAVMKSMTFETHGQLAVYDRTGDKNWTLSSNLPLIKSTQVGPSFAMNPTGSLFVAGTSASNVSIYVDTSPFCGLPSDHSSIEVLLGRPLCRESGLNLVSTAQECSQVSIFQGGLFIPCQWVNPTLLSVQLFTNMPTMNPSGVSSPPTGSNTNNSDMRTSGPSPPLTISPSQKSESPSSMPISTMPPSTRSPDMSPTPAPTDSVSELLDPSSGPSSIGDMNRILPMACLCDQFNRCIGQSQSTSSILPVCIYNRNNAYEMDAVVDLVLRLEAANVTIIEKRYSVLQNVSTECDESLCVVLIPLADLALEEKEVGIQIAGNASFLDMQGGQRHFQFQAGGTVLRPSTVSSLDARDIDDFTDNTLVMLFLALLALLICVLFTCGICISRKSKSDVLV